MLRTADARGPARHVEGGGAVLPVTSVVTIPLLSFRPRAVTRRQLRRPVGFRLLLTADEPMTDGSLTKLALIEEVAQVAGLTKKRAEIIVGTVFGSIVETLHRGEKVELRGFGSFRLRRREPRRGRNPRTGDRVDVPSKRVAYFKPSQELKELINRNPSQSDPPSIPE